MKGMATYNVIVRDGHLVSEARVDLPEGTKLTVVSEDEGFVELSAAEGAERDAALSTAWKSYMAGGKAYSADEVLSRLRAK